MCIWWCGDLVLWWVWNQSVAQLPFVWLGGGEVDVKWRVSLADFRRVFRPLVADITAQDSEQ